MFFCSSQILLLYNVSPESAQGSDDHIQVIPKSLGAAFGRRTCNDQKRKRLYLRAGLYAPRNGLYTVRALWKGK